MKRKLLSKRGETLVEVMVSLVIVILIISMLPMALETAARINARVKDIDTICSRTMADSTKTTVSVSILNGAGAMVDTIPVQGYRENGFTSYDGT